LGFITDKDLKEAKGFLIGQYILEHEDTREMADDLGYWESIRDAKLLDNYVKEICRVSRKDIISAARKYLTKNYTLAVIEQTG